MAEQEQSPLAKAIEAQNALVARTPPRPGPPSVRVRVLRAGVYNGPNHKALGRCEAGQVADVAAGAYAAALIASGAVELYQEPEAEAQAEAQAAVPEPPAVPRHTQARAPKARKHG